MKKQNITFLSFILCIVLLLCCCCGSPAKDTETSSSGTVSEEVSSMDKGPRTERYDRDNGEYEILQYDEHDYLIRKSSYSADGTLQSDSVYEPNEYRRVTQAYSLSFEQTYGRKIEQWITYLYTPDSPLVTVQWKKIEYIEDEASHPSGEYTGTAQVEYQMQDPNNRIKYSTIISGFDEEQFLIVPREYRIMEYSNNNEVASEKFKFEDAKSADGSDAQMKDGDRLVLTGTVQKISYDEAVELQGYPDYNEADKGQTWVIVRFDSPQRLQGTQDVDTWDKEYSVVLIWTKKSSGIEIGENTLSDHIGKHISFSADSFSLASDTSVPIGVPWAHDIHLLEVME